VHAKQIVAEQRKRPAAGASLYLGSNIQLAEKKFYLESVNVKYTMFGRTGNPLRATATSR